MKKIFILILCLFSVLSMSLMGCENWSVDDNTPTQPSTSGILLTKTELIGLPENSYDVEFVNETSYQPIIEVSDYELINVSIKSLSKISISLLKEGEGYVKIGTSTSEMKTINIKVIDLEITNDEDHIYVCETLKINL